MCMSVCVCVCVCVYARSRLASDAAARPTRGALRPLATSATLTHSALFAKLPQRVTSTHACARACARRAERDARDQSSKWVRATDCRSRRAARRVRIDTPVCVCVCVCVWCARCMCTVHDREQNEPRAVPTTVKTELIERLQAGGRIFRRNSCRCSAGAQRGAARAGRRARRHRVGQFRQSKVGAAGKRREHERLVRRRRRAADDARRWPTAPMCCVL